MTAIQQTLRSYAPAQPASGHPLILGVLWVLALLGTMSLGTLAVTVLFALVSFAAASQASGSWRKRRVRVEQPLALVLATALPVAAWWQNRAIAVVLILTVGALLFSSARSGKSNAVSVQALQGHLPDVAATLRSSLFVGLSAAAVVQVHRTDAMALLFLSSIVCVYDAGDYLVGKGMKQRWIGPAAGLGGGLVVVASMSAINPAPLDTDGAVWVLGILIVVLCPIGQLLGTWTLASTRASAPAVRRLDSWLLAAPALWIGLSLRG